MQHNENKGEIFVDLQRRETETGWIRLLDRFYLSVTPIWFTWLGWLAALAGLRYLSEKCDSFLLRAAWGLSVFLLTLYFVAFFNRFQFRGFPFMRRQAIVKTMSLILSMLLATIFALSSIKIVEILSKQ